MKLCVIVLLASVVIVSCYPERRAAEKDTHRDRVREIQRDCKGKCATSIAQKAAAEAKAAQAAQNAAGAQAAHMVSRKHIQYTRL